MIPLNASEGKDIFNYYEDIYTVVGWDPSEWKEDSDEQVGPFHLSSQHPIRTPGVTD